MTFRDHFAPQAGAYAAFRPAYSPEIMEAIASIATARRRCWDVGTGSGQAAVLLAELFERVDASDASASQVAHAALHPRVVYHVAPAERAPLEDGVIDLVVVAQALHWFDLPAFYAEVRRVCAPGAAIAATSYDLFRVSPDVDAVIDWFYGERIGKYWPAERRHVESGYATLEFPFTRIPLALPSMSAELHRDALAGLMGTWSAVKIAREAEAADPIAELRARLAEVWPDDAPRRVTWPMRVLAGRVKPLAPEDDAVR